jgi:hypothetical protein
LPIAPRDRNLETITDEESKAVFARSRKRVDVRGGEARSAEGPAFDYPEPDAQVEMVEQALEKLDAVRLLLGKLPEIPVGDRQSLIAQLASTADSLRALTFLDAIY